MQKGFSILSLGIIIFLFGGMGLSGYWLFNQVSKRGQPAPVSSQSNPKINTAPSPSSFPFQEITVLNLRNREYQSNLGEMQKIGDNENYTSYLTSYDSEGLKVNGLLTIPNNPVWVPGMTGDDRIKYPAIIFIHGYIPPKQYQTTQNYAAYVDYFARNGFVVFKIDLRGHGQSEGEPGGAYYSEDYIVDTLNAYSALQNSDFVNPNKIGLWGHSMAGNVVMRSMAAKPEIPAAAIWAGAVYTYKDFNEYGIDDNSYQAPDMDSSRLKKRLALLNTYGRPEDGNPFWDLVAPTTYLNDFKGAVQLNHAVDDDVVDIRYSHNLNNLLNSTKVPHELNEYQSGGHNISGFAFNQAMQKTVEFFKKYL